MAEPLDELRDSLTGDVLVEGDREYERARLCFNLLIDRRPAAIARCLDRNDAAAALVFGRRSYRTMGTLCRSLQSAPASGKSVLEYRRA